MRFITGYGRVEKDKETLRVIGLKGGVGDILHIVVGLVWDSKEAVERGEENGRGQKSQDIHRGRRIFEALLMPKGEKGQAYVFLWQTKFNDLKNGLCL